MYKSYKFPDSMVVSWNLFESNMVFMSWSLELVTPILKVLSEETGENIDAGILELFSGILLDNIGIKIPNKTPNGRG